MEETKQTDAIKTEERKKENKGMNPFLAAAIIFGIVLFFGGCIRSGFGNNSGMINGTIYFLPAIFSFALPAIFLNWLSKMWWQKHPHVKKRKIHVLIEVLLYLILVFSLFALQYKLYLVPRLDQYRLSKHI